MLKKIFLDTCVLSDIGRMKKDDRINLAFQFLNKEYQIIITIFNLIELEDIRDKTLKENIYDFLEISNVGFAKSDKKIFDEEIEKYFSNDSIDIVEFDLNMYQIDRNGDKFDFMNFKNRLFKDKGFIKNNIDHNNILVELQKLKRSMKNIDEYFNALVLNRIGKVDADFLSKIGPKEIDYNKIPASIIWLYSFANKIESRGFKQKPKEMNDVSMSYIVPYVDIICVEARQVARYEEIKRKKLSVALENKIIKRYNEVIKKNGDVIEFDLNF